MHNYKEIINTMDVTLDGRFFELKCNDPKFSVEEVREAIVRWRTVLPFKYKAHAIMPDGQLVTPIAFIPKKKEPREYRLTMAGKVLTITYVSEVSEEERAEDVAAWQAILPDNITVQTK